jgi:hypothetical protein
VKTHRGAPQVDVSVVLPCLNEAPCVAEVVGAAVDSLAAAGLRGEVIVSDNGSVDGSPELAEGAGARVVHAPQPGYGNAYHVGVAAAKGRVLVMADADGTYPMGRIPDLVRPILDGEADLVIGNRMLGEVDGMPWLHHYVGNPVLTRVLNRFFGVQVSDAHSGMRAIDAAAYRRLRLTTPGMEYASEMITQAARAKLRIAELPIDYRERVGESKLRTWRDGWRHLKFLLLASPNALFVFPGLVLLALGLLIEVPLTFGEVHVGPFEMILHPMIAGAMLVIVGYQMVQLGVLIRGSIDAPEGVTDRLSNLLHHRMKMEGMLLSGVMLLLTGFAIDAAITVIWAANGFGALSQLRPAIMAMTVFVLGAQTIFGAFVYAFFMPMQFGGGVARRAAVVPAAAELTERSRTRAAAVKGRP